MSWNEEIARVAEWMKNYADSFGIKGYVVGLSGGIDSAVTACEAVKAMGKANVIGVTMPCYSSPDAYTDALQLAENLGIELRVINLEKSYNAMVKELVEIDNMTQANIKARLRMVALYAIANKINYLVAGTGNLSELMVGYCTKHGDGAVDIEPLGNYYKTEIYLMAKYMPEIPENTKTKAPSADLWGGQTDEEELGMDYEELDITLKAIDAGKSLLLDVIPIQRIEQVQKMVKGAIHKNNPPPRYIRHL